jgi:5-methylcytosine-specific restriction endonuclease McrA
VKRLPTTPRSQVRSAIRRLWLRSRERNAALKRDKYVCQECGKKQSRRKGQEVKVQVHHLDGIEWEKVIDYLYRHVLVNPSALQTLCKECHDKEGR